MDDMTVPALVRPSSSFRARALRPGLAALAVALGLAGCTAGATPSPSSAAPTSVAASPSATATSAAPTTSATPTPSPSATDGPSVSAKGTMGLFMEVSSVMTGTCQRVAGAPTLSLEDPKNEFFQTVAVTVTLEPDAKGVARVDAELGEDSEGVTRTLAYDATAKVKNATAVLSVDGRTYRISGKATVTEGSSSKGELTPFKVTVTCTSETW